MKKIKKAVFPVGGVGTRFLPATKAMPKEMLPVIDKPLIQYAVEEAKEAGITEFVFVTGRGKTAIEDHFDYSLELETILRERQQNELITQLASIVPPAGSVSYVRQQNPLGLGHAIWCARNVIGDEPFAVILADDLIVGENCLRELISAYDHGSNIAAVMEVDKTDVSKYGIIEPLDTYGDIVQAKDVIEKPSPDSTTSNIAIIGRYILSSQIFNILEHQNHGQNREIQLTDAMKKMLPDTLLKGVFFKGRRFDCGTKIGMIQASLYSALNRHDLAQEVKAYMKALLK